MGITHQNQDIMNTLSVTRSGSNNAPPKLPNEMWLKIFSNLSHEHLLQTSLVCKDWCQIAWAPELKRKSKLVITRQKLKYICDILQNRELKCENVQVDDESGEFSSGEYKFLLQIFKHLSPHLVQVKLHGASNLSMLNNPMPKLRELDLSESWLDGIIPLHLTTSSNLKSLSMPTYDSEHLKFQLLSNLAQTAGTRLEKLSLYIGYSSIDCLGALRPYAPSLRWLKLELFVTQVDLILEHHLADIFNKFKRLESLHIKGPFNTKAIRIIFENLPRDNRLKTIVLEFCVWCNGDDLLQLIVEKWSDSLESLDLRGLVVSEDAAKQLSFVSHKLHRLELCFPSALMAQNLFQNLFPKVNKTLTELKLIQWRPIGEFFVALIQRLTLLTTLDLRDTIPTVDGEEMGYVFLHLTRLRHLFLPQCVSENDQEVLCSTSNLSNLKGLQTLHSCLCPITALQDLNSNFKFKDLTKLELQTCQRITSLSVSNLLNISIFFPVLEDLNICNDLVFFSSDIPNMLEAFKTYATGSPTISAKATGKGVGKAVRYEEEMKTRIFMVLLALVPRSRLLSREAPNCNIQLSEHWVLLFISHQV
uniref:F-box domain-containing protein n=1 Tax=Glossina austeni TaxID=7395 RepID=A0A1A9VF02_GLOAU